jgi:hypothetical protein
VSTFPNYPASASPEQLGGGPPPVQVAAAQALAQRRVTVLFRLFMLIPHFVVLYFLGIAAGIVAFIGWWAALFTGWLPEFAASFLSGYVRWSTRVAAYGMLLTDVYPPFSLEDEPGYPVQLALPVRERLNPLAVLFRIILVIPAGLLSWLVQYGGLTVVAFIAWLITLITGKLPDSLHAAYTAILRYTTRLNCYLYMLTPAYPRGLFGDAADPVVDAPYPGGYGTPPGYGAAEGYGTSPEYGAAGGYGTPGGGYDAPGGYGQPGYGTPGYGTPGGYGSPQPAAQPADWRLVLSSGTRQLLGLFVGLGVVFFVLQIVLIAVTGSPSNALTTANAISTMNTANDTLNSQVSSWESTTKACASLACATAADGKAATYFSGFASTLHSTAMPSGATAAANRLYSDATKAAQDLTKLSQVTSAAQYQSTVTSTGLDQTLNQFDTDDTALGAALDSSS